jgi:hypothetical protein
MVDVHPGVPHLDWGIHLEASPNHRLAFQDKSKLTGSSDLEYDEHVYNYNSTVATIAIESDHRLRLSYTVPEGHGAGDGSVLTIKDNDAECWVVLRNTIIGLAADGTLVSAQLPLSMDNDGNFTDDSDFYVVRDDRPRMALVMAGAISRYGSERGKAHLVWKGFQAFDILGQILSVIQQGDDQQKVGAPITSVEWILGTSPTTIVKTGYA